MKTSLCIAVLAGSLLGCSTVSSHSLFVPTAEVRSASGSPGRKTTVAKHSAARLVEESLHARGIRFGTDGSVQSLFAFSREHFAQVDASQARGGDVLFFDVGSGCGGHAGVAETAEPGGRIGFREWRDGSSRHSFVSPRAPYLRRDDRGRIMNSFLRPKRMDDPEETAYFAGEMLCAVFRVD
jgi:hypothetical protein